MHESTYRVRHFTSRSLVLATELKAEAVMTDEALNSLFMLLQTGDVVARMRHGKDEYFDKKGPLPSSMTKQLRLVLDAVAYAKESGGRCALLYNGRRYLVISISDNGSKVRVSKAFTPGTVDEDGIREPSFLYSFLGHAMPQISLRMSPGPNRQL